MGITGILAGIFGDLGADAAAGAGIAGATEAGADALPAFGAADVAADTSAPALFGGDIAADTAGGAAGLDLTGAGGAAGLETADAAGFGVGEGGVLGAGADPLFAGIDAPASGVLDTTTSFGGDLASGDAVTSGAFSPAASPGFDATTGATGTFSSQSAGSAGGLAGTGWQDVPAESLAGQNVSGYGFAGNNLTASDAFGGGGLEGTINSYPYTTGVDTTLPTAQSQIDDAFTATAGQPAGVANFTTEATAGAPDLSDFPGAGGAPENTGWFASAAGATPAPTLPPATEVGPGTVGTSATPLGSPGAVSNIGYAPGANPNPITAPAATTGTTAGTTAASGGGGFLSPGLRDALSAGGLAIGAAGLVNTLANESGSGTVQTPSPGYAPPVTPGTNPFQPVGTPGPGLPGGPPLTPSGIQPTLLANALVGGHGDITTLEQQGQLTYGQANSLAMQYNALVGQYAQDYGMDPGNLPESIRNIIAQEALVRAGVTTAQSVPATGPAAAPGAPSGTGTFIGNFGPYTAPLNQPVAQPPPGTAIGSPVAVSRSYRQDPLDVPL